MTYRSQPNLKEPFILLSDASSTGIGSILAQGDIKKPLRIIYAYSKSLDKSQMNYTVTEKELLAMVKSMEHFKHYLLGKEFLLLTDHRALEYLNSTKDISSRLLRWSLKLQQYTFCIQYIKREENPAGGSSRFVHHEINSVKSSNIHGKISIDNEKERIELFKEYHIYLGHGTAANMKFNMVKKYVWKNILKDIDTYVENCKTCKLAGNAKRNTNNNIIQSSRPNELWECDLVGRLENKDGSSSFIFVAVDHYRKWIETCLLTRKTGFATAHAIFELIIKKHGAPDKILTDWGKECNCAEVIKLLEKYNI